MEHGWVVEGIPRITNFVGGPLMRWSSLTPSLALLSVLLTTGSANAQIERNSSNKRPTGAKSSWYPRSHALCIGINEYKNGKPLKFAVNDAEAVGEELIKDYGFAKEDVVILKNATQKQIIDALDDITDSKKGIGEDDRVVIYFAGHGATATSDEGTPMGFLIPTDGDPGDGSVHDYNKTCVPVEQIWVKINGSHAKHVLVMADSCFSGLMVGANRSYKTAVLETILAKRARQAMVAGSSKETSSELIDVKHGVFTYYFLKELKDRTASKEAFTVTDIYPNIKKNVANDSNGAQIPIVGSRPGAEGDVIFAPNGVLRPEAPKNFSSTDAAYQEGLRANREGRFADALRLMAPYAEKGDAHAMAVQGRALVTIVRDKRADELYKKSAELGDPFGQFYWAIELNLAGPKQDKKASAEYFLKAITALTVLADNGDAWALYLMGRANEYGEGLDKDFVQAMKWYKKAAEKGESLAMRHISDMYRNGSGVDVTPKEVFRWVKTAADQGEDQSMVEVGKCYENAYGIEENKSLAFKYYRNAADLGNAEAQARLGSCYFHGSGVPKDVDAALKWYVAAAKSGKDVEFLEAAIWIYEASPVSQYDVFLAVTKWQPGFSNLDPASQAEVLRRVDSEIIKSLPAKDPLVAIVKSLRKEYVSTFLKQSPEFQKENILAFTQSSAVIFKEQYDAKNFPFLKESYEKLIKGTDLSKFNEGDTCEFIHNLAYCVNSLMKTGQTEEGKKLLKDSLSLYDAIQEERPWDWYTRDAYTYLCFETANTLRDLGEKEAAKPLIYRGWEVYFKMFGVDLSSKLQDNDLPLKGQVPTYLTGDDADFFRTFGEGEHKNTKYGMKRFTIPVISGGVKYPFNIYVIAGPNGYAEVQDQFRWVKEIRGCEVPKEVRDSFKRLAAIAAENHVSFMDLCLYALGTASDDKDKDKKKDPPDKKPPFGF